MMQTAWSRLPTTARLQSENGNFINGDTTAYKRKEKRGKMEHPSIFPQLSRVKPSWPVRTEARRTILCPVPQLKLPDCSLIYPFLSSVPFFFFCSRMFGRQ
ncbi:hypothetical protein LINGRAHAP2_LOCUS20838 [Linum grandiflorum]